jgi:hypothetical protein
MQGPTAKARPEPIFWLRHCLEKNLTGSRDQSVVARCPFFSCTLVKESSVILIVLSILLSGLNCARRPINPPSLVGLIAKSVSINSREFGNREFFRNCLGGLPFVIQPDISSEIAFEADNDCETELPGKHKLYTSGVGNVSSADSTTSSTVLELAE